VSISFRLFKNQRDKQSEEPKVKSKIGIGIIEYMHRISVPDERFSFLFDQPLGFLGQEINKPLDFSVR